MAAAAREQGLVDVRYSHHLTECLVRLSRAEESGRATPTGARRLAAGGRDARRGHDAAPRWLAACSIATRTDNLATMYSLACVGFLARRAACGCCRRWSTARSARRAEQRRAASPGCVDVCSSNGDAINDSHVRRRGPDLGFTAAEADAARRRDRRDGRAWASQAAPTIARGRSGASARRDRVPNEAGVPQISGASARPSRCHWQAALCIAADLVGIRRYPQRLARSSRASSLSGALRAAARCRR